MILRFLIFASPARLRCYFAHREGVSASCHAEMLIRFINRASPRRARNARFSVFCATRPQPLIRAVHTPSRCLGHRLRRDFIEKFCIRPPPICRPAAQAARCRF